MAFERALSDMSVRGGVLYVPTGTYKITRNLTVPLGVTVLGDFTPPSRENPKVSGTVIAACVPTSAEGNNGYFLNLMGNAAVKGLTIWYPEQKITNGKPIEYPYTLGVSHSFSAVMENIYLVNSYKGIAQIAYDYDGSQLTHYQHFTRNIFGTPLYIGYQAGKASDSDRQQGFDFSPKYWLGSGLSGVPQKEELENWLINNATGFQLGDIDFHYVSNINIEGYKYGMHVYNLYGRIYNFNLIDCNIPLYISGVCEYGGQLTNGFLKAKGGNNPVGIYVENTAKYNFSATNLFVESSGSALTYNGSGSLTVQDSVFTTTSSINAAVQVNSGNTRFNNCIFNGGKYCAVFENGIVSSALNNCELSGFSIADYLNNAGNKFDIKNSAENFSAPLTKEELNSIDERREYQKKGPSRSVLYDLCDYGINNYKKRDISSIIQKAINDAYADGGGVVYIPAGDYRIEKPITVKSGVELAGANDYFHYAVSIANLTVLLTDYGRNDVNQDPLITIESNAGIRGLSIVYDKVTQANIVPYATTIRGKGKNIYAINNTVVGGWQLLDLNAYRCDNHYIENFNFYTFKTGIIVGGGSKDGVILNAHSNPGELWSTQYTSGWDSSWNGTLIQYSYNNVTAFYFGECENQIMSMCATFGTKRGVTVTDGADVTIVGLGVDFSRVGIYATGKADVLVIDPQLIGTYDSAEGMSTAVIADANYKGNMRVYNIVSWNIADVVVRVSGGTVEINGASLNNSNEMLVQKGGTVTLRGVTTNHNKGNIIEVTTGTIKAYGNNFLTGKDMSIASGVIKLGTDLN